MAFRRLKDRPAPVETTTISVKPGASIDYKKTYVPEEVNLEYDANEEENAPSKTDVPLYHGFTQNRRIEATVFSSEAEYRSQVYPTINEMMEIRRVYLKRKEKERADEAKKEKRRLELQEEERKLREKLKQGKISEDDADIAETVENDDDPEDEEFKLYALALKEKKLVNQRQSNIAHFPLSDYKIFSIGFKIKMFNAKLREGFTKVLPWLYVGRGDLASNTDFLMKLGITHVLNCTTHIPNYFPGKFVYQRIPILDDVKANAGERFDKAIEFIRRVTACKGKIYIHCSAGASRAPTMIMAYMIAVRKISLLDAYNYMQAIRPSISPNKHFLYQLAELEIQNGFGSSVVHHKDWQIFEYNQLRGLNPPLVYRVPIGLFHTATLLHQEDNYEYDFMYQVKPFKPIAIKTAVDMDEWR